MAEYAERLASINEQLQFTKIKGKDYAQVNQRILAFWSLFPNGRIVTIQIRDDEQRCDFKCLVYRDASDAEPTVTGHAFEVREGTINGTSYVENCETSAIGRALGLLGIGATTAVASAEEVANAIAQQEIRAELEAMRKDKFARIAGLKTRAIESGISEESINEWYADRFGKVGMNRLDDEQLQLLQEHLENIVRESED